MEKNIEIIKKSGFYLLFVMSITLFLTSIGYIANVSITRFHLIISMIISTIIFYLKSSDKKQLFNSLILSIVVIITSILIATFVFDRSSDGNTYHKDAVGNLYLGWNPVYESSEKFVDEYFQEDNYNFHNYDIWKDHYAKANWILQANFYKLTDNIESGKAINYIFVYILFTYSLAFFYKKLGVKSWIISLIISFNPITCNQLYTFYNDQLGASLLFILIINLLEIISKNKEDVKFGFLSLFLTFPIITNIKFNIMGYTMIFTFIFMIYYLYQKYKAQKFYLTLKRLFFSYLSIFIISFGIVGYSTYIKNIIEHSHPFYPIYGENSEDIITAQQPADFINKNKVEKLFLATFAETNNLQNNKNYNLKIPFSFKIDELKESMAIDTRLSGFGIFSSGLFVLAIISLAIYMKRKNKSDEKIAITLLILINILLNLIIDESWWARYNPNNYIFIIMLCYLLLKYNKKKYINYLFISITIINFLIILLGNTYYSFKESYYIHHTLKNIDNKIDISFNIGDMTGITYNLNDYKIKYQVTNNKLNNLTYYKYLNYEECRHEQN